MHTFTLRYIFSLSQDYPGEDVLIVYDFDFKHGQNFIVALTEEAKELLLKVRLNQYLYDIDSNTTRPALSGGKLDRCASGNSLHRKWVRETL